MVIEMLLNNDIQLFFYSNDFTHKKEMNVTMYIIEILKKIKLIILFEQNFNKI